MKLSIRGLALAAGLLWGGGLLVIGLANMAWPEYAEAMLKTCSSIYPGYHASGSFGDLIVGTLYGFVDGGIGGAIFAWLYNKLSGGVAV